MMTGSYIKPNFSLNDHMKLLIQSGMIHILQPKINANTIGIVQYSF